MSPMDKNESAISVLSTVRWLTEVLKMLLRALLSRAVGSRCEVRISSETATYNADGGASRIQQQQQQQHHHQQQQSRCQSNVRHRSATSSRSRLNASPVDTATTSLDENGNPVESQRVEDDGNDNSGLCVQQQLQSVCVSDADTGRGLKRDDSNHCQPSMSNVAVDASSCETDDLKTERCHLDLDDDGGGSKDDIRTSTRFNLSRPGDASGVMRGKLPPAAVATGTVVRSRRKRSNRKKGRNQSHAAVDVEPLTSSVDDDVRGVTDVPNERCLQQLTSSVVVVVHDVNIDAFATVLDSLDAVGADATNNAENASSRTASERASDQLENRDSSSTHCVANSRPRSIDLNCRSVSSSNEQRTCGQIRRTSVDCLDKSSSCQRLTRADYSESQPDVLTNGRCSDFDASAASSSLSATDWQQRPQLATPGGKSTSDTATDVDCEAWRVAKSKNRPSRRHLGSSQPIDDRRIAAPTSADGRWSVMNASTAGVGRPKMNCKKQQVNPFNAEAARVFLHEVAAADGEVTASNSAFQEVLKTSTHKPSNLTTNPSVNVTRSYIPPPRG